MNPASLFTNFSAGKLLQYTSEIEQCLARLTDDQVWLRGCEHENSIANLVLHLIGNVRQRTAALTGQPDARRRDEEFSARAGWTASKLAAELRACMNEAIVAVKEVTPERAIEMVTVGEFHHTVLESIYHMTSHFALHTGQIIFATKALTKSDVGFYKPPATSRT